MDVDEQGKKKEDDYEEALNDPAVLQVREIEVIIWGVLSYAVSLVFFRRQTMTLITKQIIFYCQSVLESLPGVDPQSEAVRQVVRTMTTGENKDGKGGDEKKQEDKDKK